MKTLLGSKVILRGGIDEFKHVEVKVIAGIENKAGPKVLGFYFEVGNGIGSFKFKEPMRIAERLDGSLILPHQLKCS